jgi:hypothetical protein
LFLGGSLAATATAVTGVQEARAASDAADGSALKVGAGRAAIAIPASLLPIDGFTTVHDDLHVRILLLESGSTRIALVVLDLTSISVEAIADIRTAVTEAAGVSAANTVVTVTHTFSAPHVMSTTGNAQETAWVAQIVDAATTAVTAAVANLQAARVGYGTGTSDVNVNRNVQTADGWWLGTGESLPSDKSVGITRFDDLSGNPIAVLVNYNVQSSVMMESVMASGDLPITADLAGAAIQHLEKSYDDDVVGFWLVGTCGDQSPAFRSLRTTLDKDKKYATVDAQDAGWLLLTVQGERLGTEAVRVAETIKTSGTGQGTALQLVTDSVTADAVEQGDTSAPTTSHTFTADGTATVPIWVLQVGEGVFVGVEPELSTDTGLAIKRHSPFKHTAVLSMIEGGSKNMSDSWNYAHLTYEALDSSYAQGSAEKVAARIGQLLDALTK